MAMYSYGGDVLARDSDVAILAQPVQALGHGP